SDCAARMVPCAALRRGRRRGADQGRHDYRPYLRSSSGAAGADGELGMTFFAIRGSRQLTSEEFLAHIALAIRLENVGVLLGAGASKGVGGMVMTDVWALLENEYPDQVQFLRDNKFLADGEQGNVELLLDKLEIA